MFIDLWQEISSGPHHLMRMELLLEKDFCKKITIYYGGNTAMIKNKYISFGMFSALFIALTNLPD